MTQVTEKTTICVVGCGKAKIARAAPARELYCSSLFRSAADYAERHYPGRWFVMSAEHGIIHPDKVIEPYGNTLQTFTDMERWAALRASYFCRHGINRETHRIEAHAGKLYLDALRYKNGFEVISPVEGFMIGQRLAWYSEQKLEAAG